MMNRLGTIFLLLLQLSVLAQMDNFHYSREISGAENGWNRIALTPEIFSRLNSNYSDIRIIGISNSGDSVEAPYFLRTLQPVVKISAIPFQTINKSTIAGKTSITFELNKITSINEIKLDLSRSNFDWKVQLQGSQDLQEWHSILEDYRILSIDNNQVQFSFATLDFPLSKYRYYRLLVPTTEELSLRASSISENETSAGSYHSFSIQSLTKNEIKESKKTELQIKLKDQVPVSFIGLTVDHDFDYYRPIQIEALVDSTKTEKGWHYNYKTLSRGVLSSFNDQEFNFSEEVCSHLRITIENHDNSPLNISKIEVRGYQHELITRIDQEANYFLLYGNKDAPEPVYDIVNFKNQVPSSLPQATLNQEIKRVIAGAKEDADVEQTKIPGFWMWLVLGLLVLIMGVFAIRMVRKS
ncbi:discoidin domain-containing protein [bacterium]|nr:discoidin domain-containing protein [bacterium]